MKPNYSRLNKSMLPDTLRMRGIQQCCWKEAVTISYGCLQVNLIRWQVCVVGEDDGSGRVHVREKTTEWSRWGHFQRMSISNVTIALATSIIAHLITPESTVIPKAGWALSSKLHVIQYRSSAFTILQQTQRLPISVLPVHLALHCLITHTAFHSLFFYLFIYFLTKGHVVLVDPHIWEEDQEFIKVLSFLKVPCGEEQKGTTVSFHIRPLKSSADLWWSET